MAQTPPPTVDALPEAPNSNAPGPFAALMDAFLAAMVTLRTQLVALGANVYANAVDAYNNAGSAAASAITASTTSLASANFKGTWASRTGAAAVPYSVSHLGKFWMLLSNIADITVKVPGTAGEWMAIGSDAVDVFLIGGQSNARGHGSSASSPTVPAGMVLQSNGGVITTANDPVGSGAHAANTGSMWPSFGLAYYNATGRKICFVPQAVDSSAQAAANDGGAGNWDAAGALYGAAVAALNAEMLALTAAGYSPVFKGVLWAQGEQDALVTSNQAIYAAALQAMLVRFRSTYGAQMPFCIFQLGTDDPATAGFATIRAAQETVVAADPYTQIVYRNAQDFIARGLMADQYHYAQAAYNEAGRIGASNIVSAQANATQSGSRVGQYVESVVSAVASSATGTYGDLTSLAVSSGEWLFTGTSVTDINGAAAVPTVTLGISRTAGNSTTGLVIGSNWMGDVGPITGANKGLFVPSYRFIVPDGTSVTFYLKMGNTFSGGTPVVSGRLSAVRVR